MQVTCYIWEAGCAIDYAAWTQAIGTIIAILYSGYLARSTERQRVQDNRRTVILFTGEVHNILQLMIPLLQNRNRIEFNRKMDELRHAQEIATRIDPALMSYRGAVAITNIRNAVNFVLTGVGQGGYLGARPINVAELEREFRIVQESIAAIRREYPYQKWHRIILAKFRKLRTRQPKATD